MIAWTLVVHIFGQILWVGGLLATAMTLVRHARETSSEGRAALARTEWLLLRGMADAGAFLTIVAGIVLFTANLQVNLHAPWLHVKLVFVVILLGLHGWIATRSKFLSTGRITLQPGHARMLVISVIVVVLLILIFTLPGRFFLA